MFFEKISKKWFVFSLLTVIFLKYSSMKVYASDSEEDGPLNNMAVLAANLPVYDEDLEYGRHKKVSERFFKKLSRNENIRAVINTFEQEVQGHQALTRINLDNLSSRTRILLFRELTTISGAQDRDIPFVFDGEEFNLNLRPTLRQPGYGIITTIGTYANVHRLFDTYTTEYQGMIATKLRNARGNNPLPIQNPLLSAEGIDVDLRILNILLDFEVARRLQGIEGEDQERTIAIKNNFFDIVEANQNILRGQETQKGITVFKINYMISDQNTYDRIPVGSAILGILNLPSRNLNPTQLKVFFHTTGTHYNTPYGNLNAFQGLASPNYRRSAVKRIVNDLRGGDVAQNFTREQIHQEYIQAFGSGNESDGEEYLTSDSDDSDGE